MGRRRERSFRISRKVFRIGTDLLDHICPDCIPYFLSNGAEEFLIYRRNVEALASG